MKKISILVLFLIFSLFAITVDATQPVIPELTTIDITTNKTILKPNEEIELNISFGEKLAEYNFSIAYDANLVEFVSTDGGGVADLGNNVLVNHIDDSNPKEGMKLIFKGKENIITSNPTNFAITANGMRKENTQEYYNDITVSIIKNFVVEPEYSEYEINLNYTGDIIKEVEKDMVLSVSAAMGRPYEHARIIIETVKPTGATVQLLGYDEFGLKHDMIQSGWGDASGYPMGGPDIEKILNLKGIFDTAGDYTITVKMIDRDNSDSIISQKSFSITVKDDSLSSVPGNVAPDTESVGAVNNTQNTTTTTTTNTTQNNALLKTGSEGTIEIFLFTAILIIGYLYLENKRKNS